MIGELLRDFLKLQMACIRGLTMHPWGKQFAWDAANQNHSGHVGNKNSIYQKFEGLACGVFWTRAHRRRTFRVPWSVTLASPNTILCCDEQVLPCL